MPTPVQPVPPALLPANLTAWLAIATGDLVPSAQARVSAEIEAHYTEAVQAYQENGQTEFEALAAALTDLGTPEKAARRFRQTYLTRWDIPRYLRSLPRTRLREAMQYFAHAYLFFAGCWWAVKTITSPQASPWPDVVWSALAFMAVAYPILSVGVFVWLSRLEFKVENLHAKHWGRLIYEIDTWLIYLLMISALGVDSWHSRILSVLLIILVPLNIFGWLDVRRKLSMVTNDDLAPPPSNPLDA